jgi:hypothetical protein
MSLKGHISHYTIEKDTTGIVVALKGHYILIYPYVGLRGGVKNKVPKDLAFIEEKILLSCTLAYLVYA